MQSHVRHPHKMMLALRINEPLSTKRQKLHVWLPVSKPPPSQVDNDPGGMSAGVCGFGLV
jgi:hypothetical protein